MKRQKFLAAAAIIGLSAPLLMSTSSPARAQGGYETPQYQRDHDQNDRDHDQRDRDWNRSGQSQFPRPDAMRRVSLLARNVESAAVLLERHTFIRRNSLSWQERRAMGQIKALTGAASHFRAQVESYRRDPAHTQADFERLVRAYYGAGQALDNVEASGRARNDYNLLSARMQDLMQSYGGRPRWSRYDTYHGPYTR